MAVEEALKTFKKQQKEMKQRFYDALPNGRWNVEIDRYYSVNIDVKKKWILRGVDIDIITRTFDYIQGEFDYEHHGFENKVHLEFLDKNFNLIIEKIRRNYQ